MKLSFEIRPDNTKHYVAKVKQTPHQLSKKKLCSYIWIYAIRRVVEVCFLYIFHDLPLSWDITLALIYKIEKHDMLYGTGSYYIFAEATFHRIWLYFLQYYAKHLVVPLQRLLYGYIVMLSCLRDAGACLN